MNRRFLLPWAGASLLVSAAPLIGSSLLIGTADAATQNDQGAPVEDMPNAPAELADRLAGYLSARQATPLGFSPKGALLIATRFGNADQLHLVEQAQGTRRQLTFLKAPVEQGFFSPDPARGAFVYLLDVGGGGHAQLYYQRLGEPAKRITDGNSMNDTPRWSNSGHEVAFCTTARDGGSVDIDVVDPESGALPRLVLAGDAGGGTWSVLDWSPDDRKLLVRKRVSASQAYLYVLDLGSGQKKEVDSAASKVAIAGARFSRDGQGVYLISDRDAEFLQLRYINLFNSTRLVLSNHIAGNIHALALSSDGHYLAYVSNESGADKINLLDLQTHQDLTPPRLHTPGSIDALSFDADGKRLAFGFAALKQPRDAYVLDIAANHLEAWTTSEAGAVNTDGFVAPTLESFPTFDRLDGKPREIPVYVYEPKSAGPHPVLLLLHPDLDAEFRPGFDPWLQFVVNELGCAVIAPNVRGSAGYGKSYLALADGRLREDAVKDVGALLVWIGLQSRFDARHVVVAGGTLALESLVNYNERLRGAVDVAGIADLVSFLPNTVPYLQSALRSSYGDERDPEIRSFLRRMSPLTNADRITQPLLVVQGKNDALVPASQADLIVNKVRARGSQVWYLSAADEGHDFRLQQNRDAYYTAFAQFLMNSIKAEPP